MDTRGHYFRRTTLLLWLCIGVLAGLAGSYYGHYLTPLIMWAAAGAVAIGLGRHTFVGLLGVILLGLALGGLRGQHEVHALQAYSNLYDAKVTLQVSANEDAVYGKNGQLSFTGNHIINATTGQRMPGKIGVTGYGPLMVYQHDQLLVSGKLRSGIGSYQGFMSFAELNTLSQHPSPVAQLRRKLGAGMLSALPEPLGSFSMGLLIGARASLPDDVKTNLQKVGLTHIIAVSGANLTIMLEASRKVLGKRSKRLTAILSLALMLGFVLMTDGSASIIRAAFVSTLSLLAAYYGRRTRPLLIISLVAALTALINPLYMWGDASWYLSFLAFFGVLMLSPLLQNRLPQAFETNIVLAIALESFCAEVMSLPYILFTFGQISFVGLLANVLVVTFIPYAMLLGLIAGLAGTWLWPLAGWLSWPAKLLLMYMLDTASLLANRSGVFINGIWLQAPGLIFLYSVIALIVGLLSFKDLNKSAIITDIDHLEHKRILGRISQ